MAGIIDWSDLGDQEVNIYSTSTGPEQPFACGFVESIRAVQLSDLVRIRVNRPQIISSTPNAREKISSSHDLIIDIIDRDPKNKRRILQRFYDCYRVGDLPLGVVNAIGWWLEFETFFTETR